MDLAAWFQELRRRRVIRALLGWGLLSFAVLQVVEPVQHALGLGEWFLKAVVAVLAVGFPVTAGLSWAFDLTRRGVERTAPPEPDGSAHQGRARLAPAVAIALLGAVIGAGVAGLAGWHLWGRTPAPGPDGRITVAVADFVNDTKDGDLDGLSAQLITSLEQSQRLRVLTRSRMVDLLRQMGKPNVPVVDEVLGREMALAAGVRALVVASIRRFDDLYAIDLKVLDPSTSEYFFTLKEERAGKAAIPAMIDRLSEKARERLKETPAQVSASRVNVADATTGSYEAWQQYFEGLKLEGSLRHSQAIARYRRSVELDPRFALAWYRIAYLGAVLYLPEEERAAAIVAALREVDRVPAKERLLFQAWKAHMEQRDEDAHALYARAADAFPQDKDVLYMAGDLYFRQFRYAEALPWFERALALDPVWTEALARTIQILGSTGRNAEAVARARRWVELAPGTPSRAALADALLRDGKSDEAVDVARLAAAEDPGNVSWISLAHTLFLLDRFGEAEELLRPLPVAGSGDRVGLLATLLLSLTHQGRIGEAVQLVNTHESLPGSPGWLGAGLRWNVLAAGQAVGPAMREAKAFEERAIERGLSGTDLMFWRLEVGDDLGAAAIAAREKDPDRRRFFDALVAWRRGDVATSLSEIRALDQSGRMSAFSEWWHAFVAFEAGQYREAIEATDRFERTRLFNPWRGGGSAKLLYRRAISQERLGDTAGARASVERLLGWWKRADADLPLLAETRALCRKLGCQDPARPVAVMRKGAP